MNLSALQKKRIQIERERDAAVAGFDEQLATIDSVLNGLAKLGIGEPVKIPAPSVVKRGGGVVKDANHKPHKAASGKKTCPRCKKEKSTDEFGKNKSQADGLQSYCKVCVNTYAARKSSGEQPLKTSKPHHKPVGDQARQGMLGAQPGGGLQRRCSTCNKVKPIGEFPEGGVDCNTCVDSKT